MVMKIIFTLIALLPLITMAEESAPRLGTQPRTKRERREDKAKGRMFTTAKKKNTTEGIGVNSYLWKSSLETLSFIPKESVDPFGGTIITKWYQDPSTPKERLKIEVLILGRELHSHALKVSIFRERKNEQNKWIAAPVDEDTIIKFEETILTRARAFKVREEIQ